MFAFLKKINVTGDGADVSDNDGGMIAFDAQRVVRAIAFHLRDENKADEIDPQSIEQTARTLAKRNERLVISADRWAGMENLQRLRWLLDQSHVLIMFKSARCVRLCLR